MIGDGKNKSKTVVSGRLRRASPSGRRSKSRTRRVGGRARPVNRARRWAPHRTRVRRFNRQKSNYSSSGAKRRRISP